MLISVCVRSCISVKNHDQFVVWDINKSESGLVVRTCIGFKNRDIKSACNKSYINMSKSDLNVRSDVSVKNHVDVCLP